MVLRSIGPEGLIHFIGFAGIDLAYATMPISNLIAFSIDRKQGTGITGSETKHDSSGTYFPIIFVSILALSVSKLHYNELM